MRDEMAEKMAGEIALSAEPGRTIRKWRETFGASQTDLAELLELSPSVISDYESGRRKSPGTQTVQKIVNGLLDLDAQRGHKVLREYTSMMKSDEAIIDIRELFVPRTAQDFVDALDAEVLANEDALDRSVKGFTVIDSVKAITTLNSFEYLKVYGWSSERALVFTGITYGRSPMVAVRVHPMKPALIVYHRPEKVDELAVRLAEHEGIPLVVTRMGLDAMVEQLRDLDDRGTP